MYPNRVFLLWVRGVAIGFGIVRDRDKLGQASGRKGYFRDALVSSNFCLAWHPSFPDDYV